MIHNLWGEPFTKALHSLIHIVKLLQAWLTVTEGAMICLCQGGLRSPSASYS